MAATTGKRERRRVFGSKGMEIYDGIFEILHVEAEIDHVAILDDVLLALAAQQSLFLCRRDAAAADHVVEIDRFGADEAALDVGVDLARGLRGLGAVFDGPGAALVLAVGQERDEAEQRVGALDQAVEAGLLNAELLEEHRAVLAVELGDILLELGADRQHLRALAVGELLDLQEKKYQSMPLDELCSVIALLSPTTDNYPYVVDFRTDFYYIANQALDRFCIPKNSFHNVISNHKEFVYEPDYEKMKEEFDNLLKTDRCTHSMEYRWLDLKKVPVWIHCKGYLVRDDNMKPLYMIGCINEIGERQKADNVSGLLGETGFREYMDQQDTPLETGYLLRIGIDHFKEINDNFGQEYGDFVLRKTADCISGCLSEGQKVYKLVADEFLILDVSSDQVRDADKLYDKVRAATDRFIESNEFKVMYTVSGGIVSFAALEGNQYSEALKLTDFALNEAKTLGRNRCYIFDGETYRKFLRKREITQELREAVLNGCQGFTAFYQPVFAEDKKVPYGAEALMRFTSEKLGMISPAEFIPILEETGLIIPAGRWMMREAMGKCSEIRKVLPGFRVSINISQVQASKSDVIQDISAEMKRAGLPLEALIVELTESDLLEQNIKEKHFLTELRRMGISLALDDFGTGYSNFHYLSELKPEIIKIDRSFTVKAVADEQEYYLLNQFCTMIHNLDMRICIEGVENEQEWAMIRKLYPEFTQGYFWGKPCEYEEFMRKFTESRL